MPRCCFAFGVVVVDGIDREVDSNKGLETRRFFSATEMSIVEKLPADCFGEWFEPVVAVALNQLGSSL